jgi:tetratricopeptide (TPR) repeat protein
MKCLGKRPEERFASASALAAALTPKALSPAEQSKEFERMGLDSNPNSNTELKVMTTPPQSMAKIARHASWKIYAALGLVASCIALPVYFWQMRPRAVVAGDAHPKVLSPIEQAEALLGSAELQPADLASVDSYLQRARQAGDSARVQEALSRLAELRGNRLAALAHQHRAARLADKDAAPRAHLAALLSRLGQSEEACRQAERALTLHPNAASRSAAQAVLQSCPENKPRQRSAP